MAQEKIGRYLIERTIGRGAMGVVYLAFDPILDRHSAIKVMTTSGEVDEELRTRFLREARSAAKIRHPNIIAIYDMGEDQNRPYIAMEYLEGEDLKTLIDKRIVIPFEKKINLLIQVCRGLHYAHEHGVIHRDIKPANIFVTKDGEVRILDFGLARLESSELTRAGIVMGTPYYMSPEQVRGARELDGRSDLFSVGVVLYELVSHTKPFEASNMTGVCFKIVSEPHPPISEYLPGCAEELGEIIDRALAKDRSQRYANC
ncbi:MAG TPA: serine/threonine-protein kinase, partial [Terriglobia bacterium]|nr:serine/threonine-protein kinase [Terriglobia bacterium]